MGKGTKALKQFIAEIPDSHLEALPTSGGTIYSNDDFRLDMQGVSKTLFQELIGLVILISY